MNSAWYIKRFGWIPRPVRQIIILVIGGTVLLIGIIMIIGPGPAIVVVPLGLAILALEFAWAARWLHKIKSGANHFQTRIRNGWRNGTKPTPFGPGQNQSDNSE